jgi:hypothetical protein
MSGFLLVLGESVKGEIITKAGPIKPERNG